MSERHIHEGSAASVRLVLKANDNVLSTGTGFFHLHGDDVFLISAWHVLAGRDPTTGRVLHHSAALPSHVEFNFVEIDQHRPVGEIGVRYRLDSAEEGPGWYQHPEFGHAVDIGAFRIRSRAEFRGLAINSFATHHELPMRVGAEVFVVGFPIDPSVAGAFPVWKRGSIATEPAVRPPEMKYFLIDTASREGMSGAPVLIINNGLFVAANGAVSAGSPSSRFIGVYSGRYGAQVPDGVHLGIVWEPRLIDDICRAKSRARTNGPW